MLAAHVDLKYWGPSLVSDLAFALARDERKDMIMHAQHHVTGENSDETDKRGLRAKTAVVYVV